MFQKLTVYSLALTAINGYGALYKDHALDLAYTFAKVYVYQDNRYTIKFTSDVASKSYPWSYTWGNEASIGYSKQLKGSDYTFSTHFTGLHVSKNYQRHFPQASNAQDFFAVESRYDNVNLTNGPGYLSVDSKYNYFSLDAFIEADLKNTKHASFTVFGGAIAAWSERSYQSHSTSYSDVYTVKDKRFYQQGKDFYLGPNVKIALKSPFFKNHAAFNLKAGLGLLLDYNCTKTSTQIDPPQDNNAGSEGHIKNRYFFTPQLDLDMSLSCNYRSFTLQAGLNQFVILAYFSNTIQKSVVFGGPYIKGQFCF